MYCDFPELGRCCFCMPLRRGVLTFGYLNFFFSVFMIGVYSYYMNLASDNLHLLYHGSLSVIPVEACLFIYCLEIVFDLVLLYGTHLGFAVFALSLDVYFSEGLDLSTHTFGFYRGTSFIAERWLFFIMYCVEIAFIIVLLIGVHTRNSRLMIVYFYYGITTTLASLATFIFVNIQEFHTHIPLYLIDITIIFSAIVTQAYLLLLIRSELDKPRESLRFVNHLAEVCVQQPATNGLNPL
ncbi:uncharacterized protein LOC125235408 isoform X1 [Leguminivora glycinivorella]|uniref:uncharacterized protein LOC125235408 isoform X1 n=1 Tax=Leguminivora glycinivorella TaxID=1035111 RepID=UPI0020109820|nr:uncharacterized protein LOC125235408 isoform X1 [Leguminivora glycinivorella]